MVEELHPHPLEPDFETAIPPSREHPLRDLARKLEIAVADHPAYFQVQSCIRNCLDHIRAIAGVHERNAEVMRLLKLPENDDAAQRLE